MPRFGQAGSASSGCRELEAFGEKGSSAYGTIERRVPSFARKTIDYDSFFIGDIGDIGDGNINMEQFHA